VNDELEEIWKMGTIRVFSNGKRGAAKINF
jgi:hypothetical protein